MSRIKVWKEGIVKNEGDILLRLVTEKDCDCAADSGCKKTSVILCAVDADGNRLSRGNLLFFGDKVQFEFAQEVSESIGFTIDEDGEIALGKPLKEMKTPESKDVQKNYLKERIMAELDKKLKGLEDIEAYAQTLKKIQGLIRDL